MKKSAYSFLFFLMVFNYSLFSQDGKWEVLKTVNTVQNCSECGMASVDGKLYLFGNDGGEKTPVKCLDLNSLTWKELAETPVVMHHFQAVVNKNIIYVLDAFSDGGFPDQVPMSNVYSYNTQSNTWQKGGEIPAERRRAGAAAAEYKGKLYLVAGIQHGHSSGTNNMFDCYDPVTQTWTVLKDAPHIRDHCFAAVVKDKLYVVGGRNTSFRDPENKVPFFAKTVLDVDVYDFNTGNWTTLPARLPLGSGGGALVNLKDVLYYMGGERATDTERNAPRKNTYFLDPSITNQWKETDSLHFARNGMAAATLNNKIYAAGGSGGPSGPPPGKPGDKSPGNMPISGLGTQGPPPPQQDKNHHVDIEVFNLK